MKWLAILFLVGCASETSVTADFGFDGTCINCHLGMSAGHVHPNYKLRCIDCHGGDDQLDVPADAANSPAVFRDPARVAAAHVVPKPGLARFFFANGVDDDHDGKVDEGPTIDATGTKLIDPGETFEPGLHGEGPGEFVDSELSRDLNYVRFINPGDLRVATVGCGGRSRAALDGGGGGGCHQETVDSVRRSIMVNQSAVIAGAYYGNESARPALLAARGMTPDPRAGAFSYGLDYDVVDGCIDLSATKADPRGQPRFDSTCLEKRAAMQDPSVAAGAPGNAGLPAFELAEGTIVPAAGVDPATTVAEVGAGQDRLPWGGNPLVDPTAARAHLQPVPNDPLDPVDIVLRTFRAYYPLNYPGSTTNFDITFGTSILPDAARFKTSNPFGRGHSSGCAACHARYAYDGSRRPTDVLQDDGTVVQVTDPTTQLRELQPGDDRGMLGGKDRLIGRAVTEKQQADTGRVQQRTYSRDHTMSTQVDSDQCGLCHGFVTRINLAYQGMAEEEQREQLSRRAALDFTTAAGTTVHIADSWVREDNASGSPVVIVPEGAAIADLARQRDAQLAAQGLLPGAGGCAQSTFTEDCNNNGELDHALVLTRTDEGGNVIATATIDEDLNHNGKLDLIDRVPRENSIDGRQMRYIYGGRNGSTRQMDIHFERGMHCIDCHFVQDLHGDGHVYSTNWDQIEIECEDCHGASKPATLVTSGPNGGNDLTRARDAGGRPYFERTAAGIVQRSRVTPGVSWTIPQTVDESSALAKQAHQPHHVAEPREGSTFANGALVTPKLECATCHSSWVLNCMGCHIDANFGDPQRKTIDAAGNITKSARENEIWLSNASTAGHVNFQLLGLMRSPFVLGVGSSSELGRLAPFRSSMQAHVTVTDATGNTVADNVTFTTFDASGRATSGVAMNQTMPHTVRPHQSRGCETCHTLVDAQGRSRNEHVLARTFGLGAGNYAYAGDWAIAAGAQGIELFEYKQERELGANVPGASTRFPGMIVNPNDRVAANVEPIFDGSFGVGGGSVANDVVLIRNFTTPGALPTLRDLAIVAVDAGGPIGKLVVAELTGRGHPTSVRPSVGNPAREFVLDLPDVPRALAHLSPDVSDPFVYVALGATGIAVVKLAGAPSSSAAAATLVRIVTLPSVRTATSLVLAGDSLYVGTAEGTVEVLGLADPTTPVPLGSTTIGVGATSIALSGFLLVVGTPAGVAILGLDDPKAPKPLSGATGALVVPGIAAQQVTVSSGHVYVAAGLAGVIDLDIRTAALPVNLGNLAATLAPGQPINAADVVVSKLPGQTWLLVLDATGDLWGLKLDGRKSLRERCYPDPLAAGCKLDLDFLDPTITNRDPSFDPKTQTFDAGDPSAPSFFHQTRTIEASGNRLARPAVWEQIGTLTGRRVRDSFMPGSGVLSLPVMQAMRNVKLCETAMPSTDAGGLGALGLADPNGGPCMPLGTQMRAGPQCRPGDPW